MLETNLQDFTHRLVIYIRLCMIAQQDVDDGYIQLVVTGFIIIKTYTVLSLSVDRCTSLVVPVILGSVTF